MVKANQPFFFVPNYYTTIIVICQGLFFIFLNILQVQFLFFDNYNSYRKNTIPDGYTVGEDHLIVDYQQVLVVFHCCKTFAAVNGSIVGGLEGNFCFFATVCTCSCEEFFRFFSRFACVLSDLTASFTSLGLVLEAFFCIEFLFACCKYKLLSAILANQFLVFVHAFFPRICVLFI